MAQCPAAPARALVESGVTAGRVTVHQSLSHLSAVLATWPLAPRVQGGGGTRGRHRRRSTSAPPPWRLPPASRCALPDTSVVQSRSRAPSKLRISVKIHTKNQYVLQLVNPETLASHKIPQYQESSLVKIRDEAGDRTRRRGRRAHAVLLDPLAARLGHAYAQHSSGARSAGYACSCRRRAGALPNHCR